MIEVLPTRLQDVKRIIPSVFEDFRGRFIETYNRQDYAAAGIDMDFVQDDLSISKRHVLRGIHGDHKTWKLINCPQGQVYLVVLDCRPDSPSLNQWEAFTLTEQNREQILIPPGCGNAHLVLSEQAIFAYKQSAYYDLASQFSIPWNDERFGISWPIENPILSARDGGKK